MEISFCELKNKDVINVCDGKNLGQIVDIIIDTCYGKIMGIVVPSCKNFFSLFKTSNDIFIPYNRICKIGHDIILVDIIMQSTYIENNCNCCTTNNQIPNKLNIQPLKNID